MHDDLLCRFYEHEFDEAFPVPNNEAAPCLFHKFLSLAFQRQSVNWDVYKFRRHELTMTQESIVVLLPDSER